MIPTPMENSEKLNPVLNFNIESNLKADFLTMANYEEIY